MAETQIVQEEQKLTQRAMRRLARFLILIALVIFGLAVLDRYKEMPKKEVARAPAEPRALPATPPAVQPPPVSPPTPSETQPPPPPPVVSNQPLPPPEPAPAPQAAPANPPLEPAPAPRATPATPPAAGPPVTRSAPTLEPRAAPAASPSPAPPVTRSTPPPSSAQVTPSAPDPKTAPSTAAKPSEAPAVSKPAEPPALKGFVVQVGVFTTPANAQSLQKKLAEKGIPSRTETRLVVGPFADRAEAEKAMTQLKEMGLQGLLVAPH